ncbi:MAG: cytochrome-c oxidase, cbb3-type subunit III [Rhizobiaceae bacterium]
MAEQEIDEVTGVQTTGHEWDGIKELDNPMPRWWLWSFYASIIFSIGYMLYYPAIPLLEGSTMGYSGKTNRSELKLEMAAASSAKAEKIALLNNTELGDIQKNEDLSRFAVAGGSSLFKVYCTQCHGSGAQGAPGYPNLNDDDWLWGGDLETIYTTIKHGVRNGEDDEARESQMPSFGGDETLKREEITAVVEYVMKLSKQDHDAKLAAVGEPIFAEQCTACHGDNATGGREFGAPNLVDAISLYGHTRVTMVSQISKPKHGVMPAWIEKLGEANIKQLAIYVHSLGGGEKAKSE